MRTFKAALATALVGLAVAAQAAFAGAAASTPDPQTPASSQSPTRSSLAPDAGRSAVSVPDRACDPSVKPTPRKGDVADELPSIATSEPQVRDLGRMRDRVVLRTTLQLSEELPEGIEYLNVSVGPFQRSDGRALETPQVVATAHVDQNGRRKTVDLSVCVDPKMPDPVEKKQIISTAAGSYTGTVAIDDPRVAGGAATYTLNLQYESFLKVFLVSIAAALAGIFVGLVLSSGVSWAALKASLPRGAVAVASAGAASYAVYAALYLGDPGWRGDSTAFTALVVGIVGAAYTASNFAGSVARGEERPQVKKVDNDGA